MKKYILLFFFLLVSSFFYGADYEKIDLLHNEGDYKTALSALQSSFDKANPDPAVIWRIGRELYEEIKNLKTKKEKLAKLDEGSNFLFAYYNLKTGDKRDKATVMFWFTVFSSETARVKGIKESLDNIPNLFKYCNETTAVDPEYGDPYYLKAMINDGLPTLFGGDKCQMSIDLMKAISLDANNYTYFIDGATAYKNRGWDAKKKKSEAEKKGVSGDGSPADLSDKQFAKQLIMKAIELFDKDANKTLNEKTIIEQGKKLLEKL